MKEFISILIVLIVVACSLLLAPKLKTWQTSNTAAKDINISKQLENKVSPTLGIANPASVYCKEKGGKTEIVSNSDGSQFGMCKLADYSCEEMTYFKGECTIEADALKIHKALIDKGLDLAGMKVVISKHLGKYIAGSVVPVSEPAGGGYVYAVKENKEVKIVADGNGIILCSALDEYPDYPSYLISHCVNNEGELKAR